jgi:shikimate kinase
MSKAKRIFIVGHMGAGKALLGKALADKLGWKFIDANISLERTIGCALNDIIGNEGVKVFQQTLSEIMKDSIGKVLLYQPMIASLTRKKIDKPYHQNTQFI